MKAEILFVEDRVELAVPTQSRPTKIQNRALGVGDGGSLKKKIKEGRGRRKMEETQAAKESLGRMKIKDNEACAHGPPFSTVCVPSTLQCKWHMGHTSRQKMSFLMDRDGGFGANELFCFLGFVFAFNSYLEALNPC